MDSHLLYYFDVLFEAIDINHRSILKRYNVNPLGFFTGGERVYISAIFTILTLSNTSSVITLSALFV